MNLTILAIAKDGSICPPRTKKTHAQLITHMRRPILLPSAAYIEWERAAIRSLLGEGIIKRVPGEKPTYRVQGAKPISIPVNCRALIYRDALRGDAVGFYQAIGDFLQLAGVITNDKWIVSWDGSRLLKCAAKSRVELELTRVGDCSQGELFKESE